MSYSAEQYAAAAAWIQANLDNPQLIADTAAALGVSLADITIAVQTVVPTATVSDVSNWFADNDVYVPPAPVYYEPAPVYYEPAPVYVSPAPVYVSPVPIVEPAPVERFTPEQYEAAGQFIVENFDKPEVIAETVEALGLTIEEVTKAAQTVAPEVTTQDVVNYLEVAVEPIVEVAPMVTSDVFDRYSPEQIAYAQAVIVDLVNAGNAAAIAQEASKFGLSLDDVTALVQDVVPTATADQVSDFFVDNNVIFERPFEAGIYAFETAEDRDAYIRSSDPGLQVFVEAGGALPVALAPPATPSIPAPAVLPAAPVVTLAPVVTPKPTPLPVVTPAPVVTPKPTPLPVVATTPAPALTPSPLVPIELIAETTPPARGISYGTLLLGGAALLLLLRR